MKLRSWKDEKLKNWEAEKGGKNYEVEIDIKS